MNSCYDREGNNMHTLCYINIIQLLLNVYTERTKSNFIYISGHFTCLSPTQAKLSKLPLNARTRFTRLQKNAGSFTRVYSTRARGFKVSPQGFKSARTDDASFSNVRALADASSCKAANKSTILLQLKLQPRSRNRKKHLKENVKETIWT